MWSAFVIVFFSLAGFYGLVSFVAPGSMNVLKVSAESGSGEDGDDEDNDEDEDKDEDEDEDKDDDEDEKESESDKKEQEAAKKKLEREREAAKQSKEDSEDDGTEGDDDGDEVEDEDKSGDDSGMYKDRDKTVSKLQEKIAEAEKEILQKQAEGVDVTAALARLTQAKLSLALVKGAFDANDLERAKALSKEVKKLAHFAKETDLHDAKEVAEDVAKVSKRITQAYGKIVLLEAVGGDGASFRTALASLEADLATLKATIAAGGFNAETMSTALEALERKVKSVKSSVEGAIYALGGTDREYDDDYENETEDVAEHLRDVADIEEDSVGEAIRRLAKDHEDSGKKVGEIVKDVDERNFILQTLFGASDDDLKGLEQAIVANKARIEALTGAANSIEDPDVKNILLDQIAVLKEQTLKLETFVGGQRDRSSVFGWFFNLF